MFDNFLNGKNLLSAQFFFLVNFITILLSIEFLVSQFGYLISKYIVVYYKVKYIVYLCGLL